LCRKGIATKAMGISDVIIDQLEHDIEEQLSGVDNTGQLEQFRILYLGRKGQFAQLFSELQSLPGDERRKYGARLNVLFQRTQEKFDGYKSRFDKAKPGITATAVDITLPGQSFPRGFPHPLMLVLRQVVEIFGNVGFRVAGGPEIETEYYNFDALNIGPEHPARHSQDTFYLASPSRLLLRTHTSPVQIRFMEAHRPPLAVIIPGRCYRRDAIDAAHSPMFYQVEGLMVGENISLAYLKGIIEYFAKQMFGSTALRFRPSYFPFTEPSVEVDIRCTICGGKGCSVCKQSGWLEVLGAGLVHPALFHRVQYPENITGFAFGMGLERIAMLAYGIDDIRLFYENDVRFLEQFR